MVAIVVYISVLSELSRYFDLRTSDMPLLNAADHFRLAAIYGGLLLMLCAVLVVRICMDIPTDDARGFRANPARHSER